MKKKYVLILFMFSAVCFAQEYKPYRIKSGKIEYELRKYKTHSHISVENGVKRRWNEAVPYVAELIVYYWDAYGDRAFEECWEVADFSGNPTVKTKKYEMLWNDGRHYTYNFKDGVFRDDPDNIRAECKERFQFYQITGSWVEAAYGGMKKGKAEILGKETVYYLANDALDIYTWKGLPLKEVSYKTSRDGKRLNVESTRIATDITTGIEFNSLMFDSVRIHPDTGFLRLNMDDIGELIDTDPNKLRPIDGSGYEIREGDVILYVTSDYRLGKLKVLRIRKAEMDIQFVTYDSVGTAFNQSSDLCVKNHFTCDLDAGTTSQNRMYAQDFRFDFDSKPLIIPFPNLGFYLIKSSRR